MKEIRTDDQNNVYQEDKNNHERSRAYLKHDGVLTESITKE